MSNSAPLVGLEPLPSMTIVSAYVPCSHLVITVTDEMDSGHVEVDLDDTQEEDDIDSYDGITTVIVFFSYTSLLNISHASTEYCP